MPYYQFNTIVDLSAAQRQALVDDITRLHTRKFHAPSFLVNVGFVDARAGATLMYRAGRPHAGNSVMCYVRPGGRDRALFDAVCLEVTAAWNAVVNGGAGDAGRGATVLDGVFVIAAIHAAWEKGLLVPEGGKDQQWLLEHRAWFEEKAAEGDEDFRFLLEEMDTREDLGCMRPNGK